MYIFRVFSVNTQPQPVSRDSKSQTTAFSLKIK